MATTILILRTVVLLTLFLLLYGGGVSAILNSKQPSKFTLAVLLLPLFSFLCAVTYKLLFL